MYAHRTTYRVIYGDTDSMGVAYHANYLRWFEIGRAELFRAMGLTYKQIEEKGYFLPLSEVNCKYLSSAKYDDELVIEAVLDLSVKAGVKFDYVIYRQAGTEVVAKGSTLHAFVNGGGKVVRPPLFFRQIVGNGAGDEGDTTA
ncbi:MAG: thioesterase family protein [Desulfobacterales bacterium]|nr:thioesterase family protein [Desulfobacterales bacterium]